MSDLNRRQLLRELLAGALAGPAVFGAVARAQQASSLQDPPDEEIAWVCPMHPSYTAAAAGTCPICGMVLIQTKPYDTRDFRLLFRTEPADARPGEKLTLFFTFLRPGTGEVVREFEVVHTKRFHLFIVSEDLEFFEHIHPVMHPEGTWTIDTTLPKAGCYRLLCDFMPSGGSGQFLTAPLVTAGYAGDLQSDSAHLQPDRTFKKSDGDIT
ncbi:MAG TPA: heavy metal-binding domain-containing protein, partial [Steroidobacteraceae bacterium]|nr:heavy metal-binding domain-containing protein [Steroidobacteraceae bacterium]